MARPKKHYAVKMGLS